MRCLLVSTFDTGAHGCLQVERWLQATGDHVGRVEDWKPESSRLLRAYPIRDPHYLVFVCRHEEVNDLQDRAMRELAEDPVPFVVFAHPPKDPPASHEPHYAAGYVPGGTVRAPDPFSVDLLLRNFREAIDVAGASEASALSARLHDQLGDLLRDRDALIEWLVDSIDEDQARAIVDALTLHFDLLPVANLLPDSARTGTLRGLGIAVGALVSSVGIIVGYNASTSAARVSAHAQVTSALVQRAETEDLFSQNIDQIRETADALAECQ